MERVHVWIFRDDAKWLREVYGRNIGVAKAIRTMVHANRKKIEERLAERQPRLSIEIDLDELMEDLPVD